MEAIGRLIKESEFVLVYGCAQYRQSERCQTEANFAARLNKPIILLATETSGWVMDIAALSRDTITLAADSDECADQVADRVAELHDVEKWTTHDVSQWLDSIHPSLTKLYGVFDGFTLKQIYNLKKWSPEFFYQTLAKETNHELSSADIACFASKMDRLFNSIYKTE